MRNKFILPVITTSKRTGLKLKIDKRLTRRLSNDPIPKTYLRTMTLLGITGIVLSSTMLSGWKFGLGIYFSIMCLFLVGWYFVLPPRK